MSLKDTIKADGQKFVSVNDFAEPVVYYKRNGLSRSIVAHVERQAFAILGEDGDNVIPIFEVHVHNNETTGISSSELNRGGDSLEFPVVVGGTATRRTIMKLLGHDEGMLILECR